MNHDIFIVNRKLCYEVILPIVIPQVDKNAL